MDWWVIEYDNKNFDSHVFIAKLRDEFVALMTAAGGGPFGTTVCTGSATLPDNKQRFYFNPKAASIPGVNALVYGEFVLMQRLVCGKAHDNVIATNNT